METNNPGNQMQLTLALPPPTVIIKRGTRSGARNTTVTLRNQQQRAQSSLTFATVGSKPITSTHIWTCAPGQTRSLHRAGEERRDGIWLSHMMVVKISLPTTQSLPTSPSQEAFSTPPHLFSDIHSALCSPFGKESRIISLRPNTEGAAWPPPSNLISHVKYRICLQAARGASMKLKILQCWHLRAAQAQALQWCYWRALQKIIT